MRLFILIILFFTFVFSRVDLELSSQIFYIIFSKLTNSKKIELYFDNKEYNGISKYNKNILVTNKLDAVIVVISKKCIKTKKPVFVLDKSLLKCSNVIGGFFWEAGEPKLILFANQLNKFGFIISDDLKDYIK